MSLKTEAAACRELMEKAVAAERERCRELLLKAADAGVISWNTAQYVRAAIAKSD